MSHLDEGTLHALLDGELEMTEVREIQAHLGACSACGSRLRQVKEFYTEADRLVGSIDVPGAAPGASASRARGPLAPAGRGERPEPPPLPAEPPILLLPDNPTWADRSRRLIVSLKWAAVLAVAVGAGFLVSEARRGSEAARIASAPAAESTPTPVLSAEEATPAPDSAGLPGTRGDLAVAESAPSALRLTRPAAPPPAPLAAAKTKPRPVAPAKDTAPDQVVDSSDEANDRLVELADGKAEAPPNRPSEAAEPPPASNLRTEAALAMEELDRERRVARAAAATAALDSARRRDEALRQQRAAVTPAAAGAVAAPPAPVAAPPQRTLEQRAETYIRIGLDEAARQLGRPVHVIEGMSPLFMGLAQGRTSPGADSTRPVVRVVYQDAQGRLILLDQQRIRPGQSTVAPASPEPHWTMGEILLHLHGEIGPEVLRTLRSRVR